MRQNELAACTKKAFRPRTTLPGAGAAPNLIKGLEPSGVNQVWVSDITYIATLEGWLYLAIILDLFSRKVVGWKLGETLEAELVLTALENALTMRTPDRGLYFHSDRGSQYSSQAVRKPLSVIGANLSMSGVGNCYDNAKAEAFFSTLKSECLPANQVFESKAVARRELFEYIETYYNNKRLHSALGYQAPGQFEAEHFKKGSNFFEENVTATSSQKRNEVQERKRNKCQRPTRSVGGRPFMPGYDLERSEVF
jgi:transposase InsO family protein